MVRNDECKVVLCSKLNSLSESNQMKSNQTIMCFLIQHMFEQLCSMSWFYFHLLWCVTCCGGWWQTDTTWHVQQEGGTAPFRPCQHWQHLSSTEIMMGVSSGPQPHPFHLITTSFNTTYIWTLEKYLKVEIRMGPTTSTMFKSWLLHINKWSIALRKNKSIQVSLVDALHFSSLTIRVHRLWFQKCDMSAPINLFCNFQLWKKTATLGL